MDRLKQKMCMKLNPSSKFSLALSWYWLLKLNSRQTVSCKQSDVICDCVKNAKHQQEEKERTDFSKVPQTTGWILSSDPQVKSEVAG